MMFKRLVIIGCCALGGFAFGRWLSPPADAHAAEQRVTDSEVAAPVELPPPERVGRLPFVDVYRSLRSSSTQERAAYLQSLQELPNGPDRRAALTTFFQCLASINPQEAADLVRQVRPVGKDDIERAALAVMGATSAPYTPGLVKMLLDLPPVIDPKWREQKLNGQMYFWAALDPTSAAQFADQYQSTYPELVANGIIQCLAAADPAAAERWLKEHPDLRNQPEVMSDYLKGLYQNDPANARRYLAEHATEEVMQASLKGITRLTFLSSADDAVEFISHLPTKDARQAALSGILDINTEVFANSETSRTALCAGVAEWVTKFSPDDWPSAMSYFLFQWRELDPDGSVSWIAQLPSPTRSAIAGELVRHLPADRLKEVLATTAGDFHHDVLDAFAGSLSQASHDERKAVIEALELPPDDAAQLAAIVH
jgi:hypothetical protein